MSIENAKGLYYPSPEQFIASCIKRSSGTSCVIYNKDLLKRQQNTTNVERISQILNASPGGSPAFIWNANENGTREGQPGGAQRPLRNKF